MFKNGCPGGILGMGESTAGPTRLRISAGAGRRQPFWLPVDLFVQVQRASFHVTAIGCGEISHIRPVSLSRAASLWKSDKITNRWVDGCASCQFLMISATTASFWDVERVMSWYVKRHSPATTMVMTNPGANLGRVMLNGGKLL